MTKVKSAGVDVEPFAIGRPCEASGCRRMSARGSSKRFCLDHVTLNSLYVARVAAAADGIRPKPKRRLFRHTCTMCSATFERVSSWAFYCDFCKAVAASRNRRAGCGGGYEEDGG